MGEKSGATFGPEWGVISATGKRAQGLWARENGAWPVVFRPRGDRVRGKLNFMLTLLTCALCICSPLSQECSLPRTRVSMRTVVLPFALVYQPVSFLRFFLLALGQMSPFYIILAYFRHVPVTARNVIISPNDKDLRPETDFDVFYAPPLSL